MSQRTKITILALAAALCSFSPLHHGAAADRNTNDPAVTDMQAPGTPLRTIPANEMKPNYGPCGDYLFELLRRMKTLGVGSTRADLNEIFQSGGGLSARSTATYDYREGVLIHVRVEFEYDPENPNYDLDRIVSISAPYIE